MDNVLLLTSPPPSLSLLRCSLTPGPPPSTGHGAAPGSTRACLRKPKREKQSKGSPGSPPATRSGVGERVVDGGAVTCATWTVSTPLAHCPPKREQRTAIVRPREQHGASPSARPSLAHGPPNAARDDGEGFLQASCSMGGFAALTDAQGRQAERAREDSGVRLGVANSLFVRLDWVPTGRVCTGWQGA